MDIKQFRKKTGLDQRTFIRRLTPYLKGFSLDEFMLNRIESGKSFQEDRLNAIYLAIQRAFPEYSEFGTPPDLTPKKWWAFKVSGLFFGSLFLGIFLIGLAIIYLLFPENIYLKNFERFLTAIGTSVAVVGFFAGLYLQSKK